MTSTTAVPSTTSRLVVGPLTTTFSPAADCALPTFLGYRIDGNNEYIFCGAHDFEYQGCGTSPTPTCLPSVTSVNPVDLKSNYLYSPAWYCPSGWTTAAEAVSGGSGTLTKGIDMSALEASETAVLCCPSDYSVVISGEVTICGSSAATPSFSYFSCAKSQSGTATAIEYSSFTTTVSDFSVKTVISSSTQFLESALVYAPILQLNWKASDSAPVTVSNTAVSNSALPSSTAPAGNTGDSGGLSSSAKAGIGVGVTVVVLIFLGFLWWVLRRRRSSQAPAELPEAEKTELDATGPAAMDEVRGAFEPAKDTAHEVHTHVHEVDGSPKPMEVDGSPRPQELVADQPVLSAGESPVRGAAETDIAQVYEMSG